MKPARAAALLVAGVTLVGLRHVRLDATPPSFDDAWYLETAFRLYHALGRGLPEFAAQWVDAFKTKAPLVGLAPLPLFAVLGPSERVAPLTGPLLHALTCLFSGLAARELWREHARRDTLAALAAALVALIPLLYGLSRVFLVESLLACLCAAAAWRLARAGRDERPVPALAALLGLGMLAKVTFPFFMAGAAWERRAALKRHAVPIALGGAALAATWYVFNLPYVLAFAARAAFGDIAAGYGAASPLTFLARLTGQALSWPLTTTALGVAAATLTRGGRPDAGTRFALAWVAPLLLFAFTSNLEPRLWAPALPSLALLTARAAVSFDRRAGRAAAAGALLAAGGLVFVRQSFLLPRDRAMPWNGAPSADPGWDRSALVEAAARAAGPGGTAAVALEHPRLNANNLASLATARDLPVNFISLGYAAPSVETALLRLKDRGAAALIIVDGVPERELPAFLNRANAGVAAALASGRLAGRLTATVPLAPGVSARVHRLGPDALE